MLETGIWGLREPLYRDARLFAQQVYAERHSAGILGDADVYSFLRDDGVLVGVFGLYLGRYKDPLLVETFFPQAFTGVDRHLCGELGTRAVRIASQSGLRSGDVSLILSSMLIIHAHRAGVRQLGFTANHSVRRIAEALDFSLTTLGKADPSRHDEMFRRNWDPFFTVAQYGFVLDVSSTGNCTHVLTQMQARYQLVIVPDRESRIHARRVS